MDYQTEMDRVTNYLIEQGHKVTKPLVLDILILMAESEIKGLNRAQQISIDIIRGKEK